MFSKSKKAAFLVGLSALAFGISGIAAADCSSDTANQWECLQAQNGSSTYDSTLADGSYHGPYTFSGTTSLSYAGIINATCTLSLSGDVKVDPTNNIAYIKVVSGSISGSGTCGSLGVTNFPWYAQTSGTDGIPGASGGDISPNNGAYAIGDFDNIKVTYSGITICSGSMDGVKFQNNNYQDGTHTSVTDPSLFTFNGSVGACSVNGNLYSSTNNDVNAW